MRVNTGGDKTIAFFTHLRVPVQRVRHSVRQLHGALEPSQLKNQPHTAMQLVVVWSTLLVSLSGVALEVFGHTVTLVSGVLGSVVVFNLFVLSSSKRWQARLLAAAPWLYGAVLLTAWLSAFYLIYPSPLAHDLILLSALLLPVLYISCFSHAVPKRALQQTLAVLGFFVLLALPHAYATRDVAGLFNGFLFPLVLCKTHGLIMAFLTLNAAHTERLHFLAQHDPLTGLANRRQLQTALELSLAGARRSHQPCTVLILDLDHFKQVNDTYGHGQGDLLLCQVAQQLAGVLRTGNTLGRWGGEEFMVVAPLTDSREAWQLGERLRCVVAEPLHFADSRLTVSVGIAVWQVEDTALTLVTRADHALYRAKQAGRNRTELACASPTVMLT